jgi:hypothetical protein
MQVTETDHYNGGLEWIETIDVYLIESFDHYDCFIGELFHIYRDRVFLVHLVFDGPSKLMMLFISPIFPDTPAFFSADRCGEYRAGVQR